MKIPDWHWKDGISGRVVRNDWFFLRRALKNLTELSISNKTGGLIAPNLLLERYWDDAIFS